LYWSSRFICIPVSQQGYSSSGYFDINCPTSGTIPYVSGNTTTGTCNCTSRGINFPSADWWALYYILVPGNTNTSTQTNFVLVRYDTGGGWTTNSNWILIGCTNLDSSPNVYFKCAPAQWSIPLNQSFIPGAPSPSAFGVGLVNPTSYTLQVAGTIGASGDITAFYSDERLKTKTGTLIGALDKVCSLDTFTYTNNDVAKSFGFDDETQKVGLSAQQVQKVLPEVVKPAPFDAENQSGQNYLTVQYEKLVPLLVEALKEERKSREALEERIKLLEQK
jgi:hypothetical protein